jgi:ElaB/YqjD/DUF883 family membrane-anchored ribosome-binding protein
MHIGTNTSNTPADGTSFRPAPYSGNSEALERSKEELVKDFHHLIDDGEALLKSTTNLSGEALTQALTDFRARLADARTRLDEASHAAREKGRQAAIATDRYVHEKPWPAIGVAAGLALVTGFLVARR